MADADHALDAVERLGLSFTKAALPIRCSSPKCKIPRVRSASHGTNSSVRGGSATSIFRQRSRSPMAFYHDVVGLQESYRRPLVKAVPGSAHHDIGLVGTRVRLVRATAPASITSPSSSRRSSIS